MTKIKNNNNSSINLKHNESNNDFINGNISLKQS